MLIFSEPFSKSNIPTSASPACTRKVVKNVARGGPHHMYAHIVQTVEAVSVHLHMHAQEK